MGRIKILNINKQVQRNQLSPGSKLFIKLINLNLLQIGELIDKELIENPCLEEVRAKENSQDTNLSLTKVSKSHSEEPAFNENIIEDKTITINDYLLRQLRYFDLEKNKQKILYSLIELIDEDGFLNYPNDEIVEIISEQTGLNTDNIIIEEIILWAQRNFDPSGIFSRSISESLIVQLELKNNKNLSFYSELINNHLEDLGSEKFKLVAKRMDVETSFVESCFNAISELEPWPARNFIKDQNEKFYSEPEAFIYEYNNQLQVQINKNFRTFEISSYYENMLTKNTNIDKEVEDYIKSRIKDGKTLMKTILERNEIYTKVLKTIVDIQSDFIIKGDRYLKPLKLSDIASIVGTHESTISRITSNKYVSTPRGTINMKSFFSNKIDSEDGSSSIAVKDILDEIVNEEDKKNPYADEELKDMLSEKGINISRRTIAKYRKMLKIPSSFKRRIK